MLAEAIHLTGERSSTVDWSAKRLLEFFDVTCRTRTVKDFCSTECSPSESNASYRILCAAQSFSLVIKKLEEAIDSESAPQIHSVFLYSNGDAVALAKIVSQLSGTDVSVCRGANNDLPWSIADDLDGMFGAMRGLHVHPAAETLNSSDFFANQSGIIPLITSENNAAFVKIIWRKICIFISSVPLLDIDAELTGRNFDVRDYFFSAVPIVSYIRWALARDSWTAPDASACLIIDDPLLRPRYGFVSFAKLLTLMKQLRFSTSIAFIPWNWRRSNSRVVQLFKDNPEYYSLCIHGCEHTAGEFSASSRRVRAAASRALKQMSLHERLTGLAHDPIMIFPHGIFSKEAMAELKRAGFLAVVNTEVHSNPSGPDKLKIRDVWDIAVMTYGEFPLYTRRHPAQRVENFAFDLLLGKPCLVVIHHDFCRYGYGQLSDFIKQLNALKVQLVWRCLGDILRRSFRQKELSPDSVEIEMYASQILIENRSEQAKTYWVRRREHHPNSIESLCAGSQQLSWQAVGNYVAFKLELEAAETTLVTLNFKRADDLTHGHQNFVNRAKTMLRRHLSEARDNYLVPAKARMSRFSGS
jgi:hypothetical protein